MYDYNDPEFLRWLAQKYPDELEMHFGGKGGAGFDTGFGMQGGGFQLPQAQAPQGSGGLGGVAQTAAQVGAGVMSPYTSALLYGGGALLKALQGDPMEKYRKSAYRTARGQLGTDVINVGGAINQNRAAMMPQLNQLAGDYNKRFGLNSGAAQQGYLNALLNKEAGFNLNASMMNQQLKSQRDQNLLQLLAGAR